MSRFIKAWKNHGTKILGFLQVTLGVFSTATGILPDHILKWLILVSGLLTAWRGYVNSATK